MKKIRLCIGGVLAVCLVLGFLRHAQGQVNVSRRVELVFPQFAAGAGISSELTIVNPTTSRVDGVVYLFDDNGQPMQRWPSGQVAWADPYGVSVLTSSGESPALAFGWMLLRFDGVDRMRPPGAQLKVAVPGLGYVSVPPSTPGPGFMLPVRKKVDRVTTLNTGVAIVNLSPREKRIQFALWNPPPSTGIGSLEVTLPKNGHIARFIDEIFPIANWPPDVVVTMTVYIKPIDELDQIAVIGFEMGRSPGEITSVPVTPLKCQPTDCALP